MHAPVNAMQQWQPSAECGVLVEGLWSPALAPRCQHARPHRTAMKHTVGGQRLGRLALACFATEKKSWKPLFTGIRNLQLQRRCRDRRSRSISKHLPSDGSCHLTTRFHPPTQHPPPPDAKPPRNFGRAIGRRRWVCGFDRRMDCMLMSAEDAV